MSQRNSEYARVSGDTYVTPEWVFVALHSVETFWQPWVSVGEASKSVASKITKQPP